MIIAIITFAIILACVVCVILHTRHKHNKKKRKITSEKKPLLERAGNLLAELNMILLIIRCINSSVRDHDDALEAIRNHKKKLSNLILILKDARDTPDIAGASASLDEILKQLNGLLSSAKNGVLKTVMNLLNSFRFERDCILLSGNGRMYMEIEYDDYETYVRMEGTVRNFSYGPVLGQDCSDILSIEMDHVRGKQRKSKKWVFDNEALRVTLTIDVTKARALVDLLGFSKKLKGQVRVFIIRSVATPTCNDSQQAN